jgi:hypothetical protein
VVDAPLFDFICFGFRYEYIRHTIFLLGVCVVEECVEELYIFPHWDSNQSVADPHHVDADPDPDTFCHFNADSGSGSGYCL